MNYTMKKSIINQITNRIKELKDQRNWSWEKLAYSAGVSKSAICQIKNEQNLPSISTLLKICVALEMSPSEFFDFNLDLDKL